MKLALAIIATSMCFHAGAQEIPNAPVPTATNILFLADTTLRFGDVITTYKLMHDPCHCFHESDPIAPKGKAILPSVAFQAGADAAVLLGSEFLRRHHHRKLALILQSVDIESETIAVINNSLLLKK